MQDIIKNYEDNGFVIIKNLFTKEDVNRFAKIARSYDSKTTTNENITYFSALIRLLDPRHYKQYSKWLSPNYIKDSIFLINRKNTDPFKSILKQFGFTGLNAINRIDSYISYKSDEDITEWHSDQAFGGATHPAEFFGGTSGTMSVTNLNKVFVHITKVNYQNGCFSYLPKSQKINLAVRSLINEGLIKYKPILLLEDMLRLVENEYSDALKTKCSEDEINFFLRNGKEALSSDKNFVLECEPGDAVIFNDLGFHKGTAPAKSDRIIFRYWC